MNFKQIKVNMLEFINKIQVFLITFHLIIKTFQMQLLIIVKEYSFLLKQIQDTDTEILPHL